MNGLKFNIVFGLSSIIVMPAIARLELKTSGPVIGIFAFVMYVCEAWALYYKVRLTRVRIVYERTGGSVTKDIPPLPPIGCFVSYGFLIRMCFRVLMLVIALGSLGLMDPVGDEDPSTVGIIIMIIGVLFELFVMCVAWFETRIDKDEEEEDTVKVERAWRKTNFKMLDDPRLFMKELFSDIILFVAAMMFTHLFWTMSNNDMMDSIDRSFAYGESALSVFLVMFFCNFVLSMFMIVPMRLAYWIGESISVIDSKQKWKLRLSLLFAGISITLPVFSHWFRVYFL